MTKRKRNLASEVGSDLQKLQKASRAHADLARELGYAELRRRLALAPADAPLALYALLHCLLVAARLPLHGLRRLGLPGARGDPAGELASLREAAGLVLGWLAFWLGIAFRAVGVELGVALRAALVWALVALGYVAVFSFLIWLAVLVLSH